MKKAKRLAKYCATALDAHSTKLWGCSLMSSLKLNEQKNMTRATTINNISSTQTILAMVITNTRYALKLAEDPRKFCNKFHFNNRVSDELCNFIASNGQQFMKSSLLLKKKRFDAILETLSILAKIYSTDEIECMWDRYLTRLTLEDLVPKNPLLESTLFCETIIKYEQISDIEKNLIQYEIERNKSIVEHALENTAYKNQAIEFNHDNIETHQNHKPILHPSFRISQFDMNISDIVQNVLSGTEKNKLNNIHKAQTESILFCKNWSKGGILSIKLSNELLEAIKLISNSTSTKAYVDNVAMTLKKTDLDIKKLLTTLKNSGVIIFVPIS